MKPSRSTPKKLNFELLEDSRLSDSKRWVLVKPRGDGHCALLLARAVGEAQQSQVGNQTGGRVFLFLHTDDFERDYNNMLQNRYALFARRPGNPMEQSPFSKTCMETAGT